MSATTDHTRFIEAKAATLDTGKSLVIYIRNGIPVDVYTYQPEQVEAAFKGLGFQTYHIPRLLREQAA